MEADLACQANLIVCVSASDQAYYLKFKSPPEVVIVPNGVDRPPKQSTYRSVDALRVFKGRPYLMTVGSSYPPNIEGICHYIVKGGIYCVPPVHSIAICGGVADPVFAHPEYQRYLGANSERVYFFPEITDSELWAIKHASHGVMLPIHSGGGSNLKTAEALALGKWVVATSISLRGFEPFLNADGIIIADDPTEFRHAMRQILQRPALGLSATSLAARDTLYWDRCFSDSGLAKVVSTFRPCLQ
jgi:glycosyltransferase involved in cell wall biosynthesis